MLIVYLYFFIHLSSSKCSWKLYCHYTGTSSTYTIPDFISTDDWFTVQYKWVNKGVAHSPKKFTGSHTFTYIHQMDLPRNLIGMHAYQLLPPNISSSITLMHYIGNKKAAVDFPMEIKSTISRMCTHVLALLLYRTSKPSVQKVYRSFL